MGRDHTHRVAGGRIALVTILVLAAAVGGPVTAHSGDDGAHHHDGWMGTHDGMGGWLGLGALWMVLWTVLLVGIPAAVAYGLLRRSGSTEQGTDEALTELRRRYARGEIDEEEFRSRRRTLRGRGD